MPAYPVDSDAPLWHTSVCMLDHGGKRTIAISFCGRRFFELSQRTDGQQVSRHLPKECQKRRVFGASQLRTRK